VRLNKAALPVWGLSALFVLYIASGFKTFTVWDQITRFAGAGPFDLFETGHIHALRFAVMYPVIWFAHQFGLHVDRTFSFALIPVFIGIGVLLAKTCSVIRRGHTGDWRVYFPELFGFFAVLSYAMNGRMALAMLGLTIIIHAQTKWQARVGGSAMGLALSLALGLALMSVSTGTFLVGVFLAVTFTVVLPLTKMPAIRKADLWLLVLGLAVLAAAYPLALRAIVKNLEHFGGGLDGLVRMLSHGAGVVLPPDLWLLGLLALVGLAFGLVYVRRAVTLYRERSPAGPVELGAISVLFLGPFGFSTMLVSLPAYAVIARAALAGASSLRRPREAAARTADSQG
jgi:hypothetical protein